ncbi:MAG: EF-hand domain-containing protein [Acidobacteria bacterium]|nr:EF-hand domain-containing protein [Acidobacteriota bacterium]
MTITGLYTQNLTLSLNTSSSSSASLPAPVVASQKAGAEASPTAETAAPATDTVSISAEAIRMQTVVVTLTLTPAQTESAPTKDQGTTRGDALFDALDADGDGTVTKEEFVEGARELLESSRRHGRSNGRHGDDESAHGDRHDRDNSRLSRKLERLFDRVDANGDGGVEKAELAGALQRTRPAPALTPPSTTPERPGPVTSMIVEPSSTVGPLPSDATQSPVIAQVAEPEEAGAPAATNGQRQTAIDDAPRAGSVVTIAQITITIAIQQYTAASTSGSTTPSPTLKAAA